MEEGILVLNLEPAQILLSKAQMIISFLLPLSSFLAVETETSTFHRKNMHPGESESCALHFSPKKWVVYVYMVGQLKMDYFPGRTSTYEYKIPVDRKKTATRYST